MTEQRFEKSVENFANWAWQYELIIGFAFFIVLLVIGFVLMKKKKRKAAYICMGIGALIVVLDVFKAFIRLFFK